MDSQVAKFYYSRKEIQLALLNFAKSREIGVRFDGYFGKRPEVIEYLSDVNNFVKKGVLSFHASEERWTNPLLIGNHKSSKLEVDKNRCGWDLILDLDGVDFEYAKIVGKLIIDFLNNLGVYNVSTKFSGNKGFHIGIPFEAFSKQIIGFGETRLLFPDAPKRIAMFLMHELKDPIINEILKKDISIENIEQKYSILREDLISNVNGEEKLNYLRLIEIDTILITSRHLFRMPYSFNEKSGLISVPIKNSQIINFQRDMAKPSFVKPEQNIEFEFLLYNPRFGKDGDILLAKAYEDDYSDEISINIEKSLKTKSSADFVFEITEEINLKDFPKSIQYILNNQFQDGRKRIIFLLLTFLHSINWKEEQIKILIEQWNDSQENGLKKNYLKAQFNWFTAQDKNISPPNYNNNNYYKSIGIPKSIIDEDVSKFKFTKVKNPLHYVYLLSNSKIKKKP